MPSQSQLPYLDSGLFATAEFTSREKIIPVIAVDPNTGLAYAPNQNNSPVDFIYEGEYTNFTALNNAKPPGTTGRFAYVLNSQGTKWLPGSIGGDFYDLGWYYDNGTDWTDDKVEIAKGLEDINTALTNHINDTSNPHNTSIANIGSGTLAQLNAAITDATLDDASDPRPPVNHASTHESGGSDQILHQNLQGAGTNTHAQIDSHIADTLIHQPVIQRVEGGRAAPNTSNQYLRSDDRVPMNLNGQRLNYDTTLVSLMVSTNGAETWNAEVRKNGVATPVYTESVTASDYEISVPNVDFDADDEVQFYCNGTGINRPKMIGIFQRR